MKRRGERILVAVQKAIPINLRGDAQRASENPDYYILASNGSRSFLEKLVCIRRMRAHLYNLHPHNLWTHVCTDMIVLTGWSWRGQTEGLLHRQVTHLTGRIAQSVSVHWVLLSWWADMRYWWPHIFFQVRRCTYMFQYRQLLRRM